MNFNNQLTNVHRKLVRLHKLFSDEDWNNAHMSTQISHDLTFWDVVTPYGNIDQSYSLTHWGRETYIGISKLPIIGSDNGLSPGRRQAIIFTNAGILLIGPLWTNFSGILIKIQTFSFKKKRLKVLSAKWRPFCRGLNVLLGAYGAHLRSVSNEMLQISIHKSRLRHGWH